MHAIHRQSTTNQDLPPRARAVRVVSARRSRSFAVAADALFLLVFETPGDRPQGRACCLLLLGLTVPPIRLCVLHAVVGDLERWAGAGRLLLAEQRRCARLFAKPILCAGRLERCSDDKRSHLLEQAFANVIDWPKGHDSLHARWETVMMVMMVYCVRPPRSVPSPSGSTLRD